MLLHKSVNYCPWCSKDPYMVYNVLVFAEKETTELQYKTHAELQIKRLEK